MAVRDIVLYAKNETALRKKSEPVRVVNRRIKKLIRDLKDTLAVHPEGIGLAAPQINVHQRIVVVRLGSRNENGQEPDPPIALVNPEIIEASDPQKDFDGCLSFPGLFAETTRPHYLRVKGLNEYGKPFDRIFEDFDAVLVHHEIDHLEGILFIDRLDSIDDLYRVEEDEEGQLVRVPVAARERNYGL
ncbi:MAG: peptide deformylase [Anaerolineae bacterium]|nr:peptide deformylase [Anaerolineae bacterium]